MRFSQRNASVDEAVVIDAGVAATTAAGLPRCRAAYLEVKQPSSWDRFVAETVRESGGVDILVNNAGVPSVVARGRGDVINVASMAGMIPIPGMVTYLQCIDRPSKAHAAQPESGVTP